ncbi:GNAT family N-acetyltransferase [Aeromonas finlandensis]|uniref:GNAT family N-acetyltransferase n=1 Tax=Aeromonas finlandensis TaxID=1543375 RepID=UPI0019D364B7|nr:GNAT family N-acetyltransferase [Aeromonas finlandensis]
MLWEIKYHMKIYSRQLNEADLKAMKALLIKEGKNEWNYITDASIEHQFQLVNQGKAIPVLAEDNGIVGFAVLIIKEACPAKLSKYAELSDIAYVNDVVVAASQRGKGLGSQLLKESIKLAGNQKCSHVYIERHEENLPSAGMMRKAGFELVETFYDPNKRTAGSRKTSVLTICTQQI